jgi:hypothetical protein
VEDDMNFIRSTVSDAVSAIGTAEAHGDAIPASFVEELHQELQPIVTTLKKVFEANIHVASNFIEGCVLGPGAHIETVEKFQCLAQTLGNCGSGGFRATAKILSSLINFSNAVTADMKDKAMANVKQMVDSYYMVDSDTYPIPEIEIDLLAVVKPLFDKILTKVPFMIDKINQIFEREVKADINFGDHVLASVS